MIGALTLGPVQAPVARLVVPLSAVVRAPGNPNGFAVFRLQDRGGKTYVVARNVTPGGDLRKFARSPERRRCGRPHCRPWRRIAARWSGGPAPAVTGSMAHRTDADLIAHDHNTARFFVEHRQIAWAALVAVVAWGAYGYFAMPQRKDPEIPVRVAVAACQWPARQPSRWSNWSPSPSSRPSRRTKRFIRPVPTIGASALSRCPGSSFVYVQLSESTSDSREQFSDINLKLQALDRTAAAGRHAGAVPKRLRRHRRPDADHRQPARRRSRNPTARAIGGGGHPRERARRAAFEAPAGQHRLLFSAGAFPGRVEHITEDFRRTAERAGILDEPRIITGRGFIGVDGGSRYRRPAHRRVPRTVYRDPHPARRDRSRCLVSRDHSRPRRNRARGLTPCSGWKYLLRGTRRLHRSHRRALCWEFRKLRASNAKAFVRRPSI